MTEIPHFSYDQVPYPSLSYSQTHPDRLATLATLLGMEPAPIENCRLLALGCAGGGNILPMAYTLPESTFVGIDVSARQIEQGQTVVETLGMKNITLECVDIMDVTPDFGEFDYIIAHGVYSWVPAEVRGHLLRVCKENLAPQGVAYVSYNAYPGWHMMAIIRDAMLFHTREITDPQERAQQARAMVDFLAEHISDEDKAYGNFLRSYVEFLRGELKGVSIKGDSFLLHDELEAINEPVYFHQFVDHASEYGLQYLVEAELPKVFPDNFAPEVKEALSEIAVDVIEVEQYMDFLRNRTFRQTLLCHDDVAIQRSLSPAPVRRLSVASWAEPVADDPDVLGRTVEKFRSQDGATLATDHPVSKAALLYLNSIWPRAIPFDDLLATARERVGAPDDELEQDTVVLAANLLRAYGYSTQLVELHSCQPPVVTDVRERPVASLVARIQAQDGVFVTSLWHHRIRLDAFERALLQFLDGEHDREALVQALGELVEDGVLTVERAGQPLEMDAVRDLLHEEVTKNLRSLAQAALLTE